jgi:hypothetical protein
MKKLFSRSIPLWMGACVLLAGFAAAHSQASQKQKKTTGLLAGYTILETEKFTIQSKAVDAGFTPEQEAQMEKDLAAKMREKALFAEVVDAGEAPASPPGTVTGTSPPRANSSSRILVSGEIVEFNPGSAAKRSLDGGAGLGHATLKMHFVFRDATSGKQIFALDEKTRYYGGDPVIDNVHEALAHLSNEMVNALIRDIIKNR